MFAKITFILIGLLLAFTASAKLWMLLTDPFADLHSGYPVWFLWLGTYAEIAVIWCVVDPGFNPIEKWLAISGLFAAFVLVSASRVWAGIESCGCFGSFTFPPALSLAVSLSVVSFSVWQVGKLRSSHFALGLKSSRTWQKPLCCVAAAAAATLVSNGYHSASESILSPVVKTARVRMFGTSDGSPSQGVMELTNTSGGAIDVIGMQRSCNCMASSLPARLEAESKTAIPLSIRAQSGRFRLILFLNSKLQQRVAVDVELVPAEGV